MCKATVRDCFLNIAPPCDVFAAIGERAARCLNAGLKVDTMLLRADFLEHHAVNPANIISALKTLATMPNARTLAAQIRISQLTRRSNVRFPEDSEAHRVVECSVSPEVASSSGPLQAGLRTYSGLPSHSLMTTRGATSKPKCP